MVEHRTHRVKPAPGPIKYFMPPSRKPHPRNTGACRALIQIITSVAAAADPRCAVLCLELEFCKSRQVMQVIRSPSLNLFLGYRDVGICRHNHKVNYLPAS